MACMNVSVSYVDVSNDILIGPPSQVFYGSAVGARSPQAFQSHSTPPHHKSAPAQK
ncbi:MAG: hypothetical protein Q9192_004416 [Flavoplaca navasiana]